jgi:hypothetical protein
MPPFAMHSKASRQKGNVTLGGAASSLTLKSKVVLLYLRSDAMSEIDFHY